MMKKLLSLAILGALLAPASSAFALAQGVIREVAVDYCPAGFITFYQGTRPRVAGSCAYVAEWIGPYTDGTNAVCSVVERRTLNNLGCWENAAHDFSTTVTNAGAYCEGFDDAATPRCISDLWLGESDLAGLHGTVCMEGIFLPLEIDISGC